MTQFVKPINYIEEAHSLLGGYPRRSRKRVPHLVLSRNDVTYSLVYFRKSKRWRLFSPWPSYGEEQTKVDFYSLEEVQSYLK